MRYILFTVYFLLSYSITEAQIDTFNISNFARPDLRRETASILPNFSFNNFYQKSENNDEQRNDFNFALGGNHIHTLFLNTKEKQFSRVVNTKMRISYFKSDVDQESSIFTLAPEINVNQNKKNFLNDNQQFSEFGINVSFQPAFTQRRSSSISKNFTIGQFNSKIEFPFYFGTGRIELVNDAWQAVTILEFLEKENLLDRSISTEEIQALAEEFSDIKNLRNTDNRLETIAEYERLVRYFIDNELVKPENYRFYAHLQDAWVFESFITRLSGKEIKYGIRPSVSVLSRASNTLGNQINSLASDLMAAFEYNHYRPTSADWQRDFNLDLEIGQRFFRVLNGENKELRKTDFLIATIKANYGLNYIPNRRTNYSIFFGTEYFFSRNLNESQGTRNSDFLNAIITANYNYYFSPQLSWRFQGNINFALRKFGNDFFSNRNALQFSVNYRFY